MIARSWLSRLLVAAACLWTFAPDAHATHFRYGHYTWEPTAGSTVQFTLQNAFRRNGYGCVNPTTFSGVACSGPDGLPGVGDVIAEEIGGTVFATGDGGLISSPFGELLYVVTAFDADNNWLFGLALDPSSLPVIDTTITHEYAGAGDFLGLSESCCRISFFAPPNSHLNNPDGEYRVETAVGLGSGNYPPVSVLPPIVSCEIDSVCTFNVQASDADGDPLHYRLSSSAEAGAPFIQPGPPQAPNGASIGSTDGVFVWDTTDATLGSSGTNSLYSAQVTIEDLAADGAPKSKVALDFLIRLVPEGDEPTFPSEDNPVCGTTIPIQVGEEVSFVVTGTHPDPTQTILLNAVGVPANAALSPALPTSGTSPVASTFTWTPDPGQAGVTVISFTATDLLGRQGLCSVTLSAFATTTTTVATTTTSSSTTTTTTMPGSCGAPEPTFVSIICRLEALIQQAENDPDLNGIQSAVARHFERGLRHVTRAQSLSDVDKDKLAERRMRTAIAKLTKAIWRFASLAGDRNVEADLVDAYVSEAEAIRSDAATLRAGL